MNLFGLNINVGALINTLEAARASFTAVAAAIRVKLLGGTLLQSDATGLWVGKRNWWLWCSAMTTALFSATRPFPPRKRWRISLATSGPISGSPTATACKWARRRSTIRSASLNAGDDNFAPALRHLVGRASRIAKLASSSNA
jgi:hypothetical protein